MYVFTRIRNAMNHSSLVLMRRRNGKAGLLMMATLQAAIVHI